MLCKFSLIIALMAALACPSPVFARGGARHKLYTKVHEVNIGGKRFRMEIGTGRPVQCIFNPGGGGEAGVQTCLIITCLLTGTIQFRVNTCPI
jgi:hypothetical protein